ncbi:hypothetical protein [Bhargavaea beijingensis]|uniref:hypothetical protein n=1 Tax=Bhargavaea beijingensis TaxID=426756 RepID=UPI0021AE197C|nr:hypothetical protein [Bhargavaea beijingensis]
MVNGDANSRAHWVTYALGTVATSIVGTKGANALVKTGTTAAKASVPRVVSATNHASASLANLLPYTPRPQLAMAGGIPYNVVNGVQLKDQLITMAKAESGVSGVTEKAVTKGTGDFGISKITQNSPQNVILGELDNLGRPTGVTATITQDMIGTGSKASQSIKPPGF